MDKDKNIIGKTVKRDFAIVITSGIIVFVALMVLVGMSSVFGG